MKRALSSHWGKRPFSNMKKIILLPIIILLMADPGFSNPVSIENPGVNFSEITDDHFGALLTLEEAVERSMNQHAALKRAIERFRKEKARLGSIRAGFFPKLGLEATGAYDLIHQNSVIYADMTLEQPLFQGGKTVSETRKQKTRLEIEKERMSEARLDIELEVRLLYIQILREKELVRLYQNEVQEIRKEKERFKKLVQKEIFSLGKLRKVKTLYEKAKASLVEHKENYDYLASLLNDLVGLDEKEALELEPLGNFPELEKEISFYLGEARSNDPLYKVKSLEVKEKEFERKTLQAQRWPTVSLAVKGNIWRDEYIDTDRVLVGIQGKWNIWDFGRLGGEIKAKQHEMEETKWAGELEIKAREKNIKRLFHQARALREKIRLKETELQEKEAQYKEEKIRVVSGTKGIASLVDSYLAQEDAKMENINVITEYRITLVHLDRFTGLLAYSYQPEEVTWK